MQSGLGFYMHEHIQLETGKHFAELFLTVKQVGASID